MKNNRKDLVKRVLIIATIILTIVISFIILGERPTHADSGFDYSYDSGGSDWGSSSWSSSDYDYGYDGDWNLENGSDLFAAFISIIIPIVIIFFVFKSFPNNGTKEEYELPLNIDNSEVEERIKQYIPNFDKEEFLEIGYKIYTDVQNAWMNFELENVKDIITPELYSSYESQLATLEVKGEKNIMKDFVLSKSVLKDVEKQNETITITSVYVIELYDYIIDTATEKVLRGTKNNKAKVTYEMKFRKTLGDTSKTTKCPNCGAEVDINTIGICPYCRSELVTENKQWVLTEKKVIGQILL